MPHHQRMPTHVDTLCPGLCGPRTKQMGLHTSQAAPSHTDKALVSYTC